MKKICYITTISSTIKAFFLETLDYLNNNGYDVTVICNADEGLEEVLPKGIHYIPIPMERGTNFGNGIKAVIQLYRVFVNEKFDLIQYSTPNAAFYSSIAGTLAGIKIKLYHNMGFVFLSFHGIKREFFLLLEKTVCRLSDKVQFVSKSNLTYALNNCIVGSEKAYVVWNGSSGGVNLNRFNIARKLIYRNEIRKKYAINEEDFVFGYVGRINKDKGIDELFSAFGNISRDSKYKDHAKLMIVGPDEGLDTINQDLLRYIKDNENVFFCGSQPKIEEFYSAMDVLVLPSYREGFGNVIIEAEAMGVSVIASDIPGPADTVIHGETGLLFKSKNVQNLEECMQHMMNNKDLTIKYGEKGVRYAAENFDSRILVERILEDKNNMVLTINCARTVN